MVHIKDDGAPNFGLFCWLSYCWDKELHVMACIGGEKLTKDLIRKNKVFSANLVTETMLPLADYLGNTDGHKPEKMSVQVASERGHVLNVPILEESPWSFELEVVKTIPLDGSEVYLCKIRNTVVDAALADGQLSPEERLRLAAPVSATGMQSYHASKPEVLGMWGQWAAIK